MFRTAASRTLALILTLTASTAAADDATEVTAHGLAAMDRATGANGVAADLSFVLDTSDSDMGGFANRLDLHGRYAHESGFGGYGAVGVSKTFLSSDDPFGEMFADMINEETALTNLEIGGLYRRDLRDDLSVVARVGIALPTASDGAGMLANFITQQGRLVDLPLALPDTTTLRLGVAPAFRRGAFFARADVGLDVVLDQPAASDPMSTGELDPLAHASLALGFQLGKLTTAAQVVTVATTGDVDDSEDRFMHSATVEARYDLGRVAPSIAITTPLDDSMRGDLLAITASIAAKF